MCSFEGTWPFTEALLCKMWSWRVFAATAAALCIVAGGTSGADSVEILDDNLLLHSGISTATFLRHTFAREMLVIDAGRVNREDKLRALGLLDLSRKGVRLAVHMKCSHHDSLRVVLNGQIEKLEIR